jgi:hypothetical protein
MFVCDLGNADSPMKSGWVEFVATFERRLGLKILHVAPNARHRSNFFALAENDGGIFRLQISGYFRLILAAWPT